MINVYIDHDHGTVELSDGIFNPDVPADWICVRLDELDALIDELAHAKWVLEQGSADDL